MQHNPSSVTIYSTNEYSRFKMLSSNRQLNELKIKRIIREIMAGNNMLKYNPIQVKEKDGRLEILDGQHRWYICKHLKCPVHYILVTETKTMGDIARNNSNVEKWTPANYLNCYVQENNPHYKQLQLFVTEYGFNILLSAKLLYHGNPGNEGDNGTVREKFQTGKFEVKHKAEAEQLASLCTSFTNFDGNKQRAFIIAIYRIQQAGKIEIQQLVNAYLKRPDMLTVQPSTKDYILHLEKLINLGKQKRIIIS